MAGVLPAEAQSFLTRLGTWVRSLGFKELVSAIYREFPEMRANSVFRE